MELRLLEYFLAIANEKSITGAAHALHVTQPTLSRQLKDLEQILGKQLVRRGSRSISLTEEGKILKKRAQEILDLVKRAADEVRNYDEETISGPVYIGAGESQVVHLLTQTAQKLQKEYPDIKINIISGDCVDLIENLNNGLLDFALVYGLNDQMRSHFYSIKLPYYDKWGALIKKDSPLAKKEAITPEDLEGIPLIVSREAYENGFLNNWFGKPTMNIAATYNLVYNGSLMVLDNMGVALTFEGLIDTSGESPLTFRRLLPPLYGEPFIIWKKNQVFSKAADLFLNTLLEKIKKDKILMEESDS